MINLSDIGNLNPACGHNLGGLHYLKVIPADNVVSIPKAVNHILPTELVLTDSTNFLDVFFDQENATFKESPASDDQGEYYKPTIEVYVAKDTPDAAYWISRLEGIRCICIYQDGNGYAKVVGSKQFPLTFRAGLDITSKNGHTLSFSCESEQKAYFYMHYEVAPVGTRKVFSAGFTFGFLRQ